MFIRKNLRVYFTAMVLMFLICTPLFFVFAADTGGIVNCGKDASGTAQDACTICHLIEGIHRIVKYITGLMVIVAITVITIAGIMYVVSAGGGMVAIAKKAILNTLVGITIVLVAFMSITFILNNMFGASSKVLGAGGLTLGDGWNFACDKTIVSGGGTPTTPPGGGGGGEGTPTPPGQLAAKCDTYDQQFKDASGGDQNMQCLLKGIAMQESSCNPNVGGSTAGAYGLMQLLPSTAKMTPAQLNDPNASITKAAEYLKQNQGSMSSGSGFDIGKSSGQNGKEIKYGAFTYDTGNDDLIASYNAGAGSKSKDDSKKGPFATSTDCPNPPTPAWQCNINPGGFKETQDYVQKVQNYQKQCLNKLK